MKLEQLAEKIIESSKDIKETVKESREGFKRGITRNLKSLR
ncbi:MAG: hypothetical protein ACPLF9_07000 [Methanothermobacter tenebrarum]